MVKKINPQWIKRFTDRAFKLDTILIMILLSALILALVMAASSDFDSHPDEKVHFEAVKYYSMNYWLPPAIGHPDTLESYSVYGHSRLNELCFYYFFAGKFAAILLPVTGNLLLSARLFNVFLCFVLIILCIRASGKERLLFTVLLLTPQVWYIFSYVNSDAYALFLSMAITAQLVFRSSLLMRYLNSTGYTRSLYLSLPLVLMVLLLYFTKANFYIYFIFLLGWGVWFLSTRTDRKQLLIKTLIMFSLFLAMLAARNGLDYAVYGPGKETALKEMRELTASDEYKPSARAEGEGHPQLNLKQKGISYLELFSEPYNWHRGIFYSFTGAYGHLQYFGSSKYYQLVLLFYLTLTSAALWTLWKRGGEARLFLFFSVLLAVLTVYLASNHSWASDFQPQGRYLFPMLGVAAFLFGRYGKELGGNIVLNLSLLALSVLSVYSFIVYGLMKI